MKSKLIFLMCLFLTLSAGKMLASTSNTAEKDLPVITYSFNLGDISDLSVEEIEGIIDEAFASVPTSPDMEAVMCKATVSATIKVKVAGIGEVAVQVSVEISGPCSEIIAATKQVARDLVS